MPKQPMRVIIVGAGLAGLALAHGLQKMNIDFVIVDRETGPRDRNWCITMSWSLSLLQKLLPASVFESINLWQPDPTTDSIEAGKYGISIRDGSTGKLKIRHLSPEIRRINHKKTKHHLSQGLPVKYGKLLVDITLGLEGEVTTHFADGTSQTGTVVVGADGGVSKVRRWLLGDNAEQEALPCHFVNFSFKLPADTARWLDRSLGPTIEVAAHPRNMYMGLSLLDKPDSAMPETWLFYILAAWKPSDSTNGQDSGNLLADLRSFIKDWTDPFRTVIEKLPDDTVIRQDGLKIWHTKAWNNHGGRITLIGDAAHSMTFHRGQGGNLAVKDSYKLFNKLLAVQNGQINQKDAIDIYDQGALLRGEEVEISRQCTMAFLDYKNFENSPLYKLGINPAMKN